MPFGNKKSQGSGNNFCGGFALCAVLSDLSGDQNMDPIEIYNQIQGCQSGVPKELGDLIKAMSGDSGTNISLPSSLVRCAQLSRLEAIIYYKKNWRIMNCAPEMMPRFIYLENIHSRSNAKEVESDEKLFGVFNSDIPYFLVLVNNDTHWIAVKREPDRQHFTIYDPGIGNAETVGTNEIKDICQSNNLIITLQKQQ